MRSIIETLLGAGSDRLMVQKMLNVKFDLKYGALVDHS